jgi:hypothetical protein
MTSIRRRVALIACAFLPVWLTACGGGGGSSSTGTAPSIDSGQSLPSGVAAQANANCRELVARTKALTHGVFFRYPSVLEATTEGIVRPGIPLMEQTARKQRALSQGADNPAFDRYVELFDPLIVIGQQLLTTGRAHDTEGARRLEGLLVGIGVEQRQAARAARLADCEVDFTRVVIHSGS